MLNDARYTGGQDVLELLEEIELDEIMQALEAQLDPLFGGDDGDLDEVLWLLDPSLKPAETPDRGEPEPPEQLEPLKQLEQPKQPEQPELPARQGEIKPEELMPYPEAIREEETKSGALTGGLDTYPEPPDLPEDLEGYRWLAPEPLPEPESPAPADRPPKGGKAGRIASAVVFYGLLLGLVVGAFLIAKGDKTPVFGYSFMNVLTNSMQSEIPQGSLVVVKDVDKNSIQIGNDITFMKDAETLVTHRVIGITENYEDTGERGFETWGIENERSDFDIVLAVNVVGVVKTHIPKVGEWLERLRENLWLVLGFIAGIVLLVFLLKGAFKKGPESDGQKKGKHENSEKNAKNENDGENGLKQKQGDENAAGSARPFARSALEPA